MALYLSRPVRDWSKDISRHKALNLHFKGENIMTIAQIAVAFHVSLDTARLALNVIRGKIACLDASPKAKAWFDKCYNPPSHRELLMESLNDILGGYGVEVIHGRYVDQYYQDIQAAYINTGDTYSSTILLDHETNRLQLTTWGDWFESHEKRRKLF